MERRRLASQGSRALKNTTVVSSTPPQLLIFQTGYWRNQQVGNSNGYGQKCPKKTLPSLTSRPGKRLSGEMKFFRQEPLYSSQIPQKKLQPYPKRRGWTGILDYCHRHAVTEHPKPPARVVPEKTEWEPDFHSCGRALGVSSPPPETTRRAWTSLQ